MIRILAVAAVVAIFPVSGFAQTWRVETVDTGGLIYGSVFAPEYSLAFNCNTPSPQRRPLIETGDHETLRSAPFGMFVNLSGGLIEPSGEQPVLAAVTLTVDGTGYRLPPVRWDDFYGDWSVELSLGDALFTALAGADDLVLESGSGAAWRYPTDGLAAGLEAARAVCVAGWTQAGQSPSPGVLGSGAASPVQPQPAGLLTPEIDAFLRRGCGAGYSLGADAIAAHDLDRDGAPDAVLDWAGVTCGAAMARPFCGAAYCSIDVFLSSRPGDPQSFLGVGYRVVQAANGAAGLQFGGTAGGCARGECDRVFWWDGAQFRE